jgi:hypothetical protein
MFAPAQSATQPAARQRPAKGEAVVRKYVRAYPGLFYETPDGKIGGLPEGANITPLRRPEEPS